MSQLPARPVRQVDRLAWMPWESVLTKEDLDIGAGLCRVRYKYLSTSSILTYLSIAKLSTTEITCVAIYKAHKESQET